MAATNRVLTVPASTSTTTPIVCSSVTRRPSTWRFGTPMRASAASISRPPPWTTARRVRSATRASIDGQRREPLGLLEQLAAELE